jgi:hypothetical protein
MSGYVIEAHGRRSFGVMARCVARSSGQHGCTEDGEVDVLRLRLTDFQVRKELQQAGVDSR